MPPGPGAAGHIKHAKGNPMVVRNWSPDVRDLGDRIVALTVSRAVELSEYLERVHGVKVAAAAVVVRERKEDKEDNTPPPPTDYDVRLDGFETAKKINVIKVVRELTALGLKEAKDLVEGPPRMVKGGLPKAEAEELKGRLEAAGAKTTLVGSAP
jgi:large subunit ribosomal protein L7/L12